MDFSLKPKSENRRTPSTEKKKSKRKIINQAINGREKDPFFYKRKGRIINRKKEKEKEKIKTSSKGIGKQGNNN